MYSCDTYRERQLWEEVHGETYLLRELLQSNSAGPERVLRDPNLFGIIRLNQWATVAYITQGEYEGSRCRVDGSPLPPSSRRPVHQLTSECLGVTVTWFILCKCLQEHRFTLCFN